MHRLSTMHSLALLLTVLALPFSSAATDPPSRRQRDLQPLPLSVNGQWIVDARNATVALVGVNWPGHERTMLPEGLQYQSIPAVVAKIAETGFNSVRMTFAIEMVDDILDGGGGDVTLKATLQNALGPENGTAVLDRIVKNNPGFNESTTRLEVWDAVASELARRDIYLHLDNHVSEAGWCCDPYDGNGWFGDTYFNTTNWIRGLSYMAQHGKANWKSFSSMGLRNELRDPFTAPTPPDLEPKTWATWKTRMLQAAAAIHGANPDVLIFFGGRLFDFDISAPVQGTAPGEPDFNFTVAGLPFSDKFVFEQHQYDQGLVGDDNCTSYDGVLTAFGSNAGSISGPGTNRAPLVMSEWGHDQTDGNGAYKDKFRTCLMRIMVERRIAWMVWVMGGSYYIRQGVQDRDEPWALLNHDWSSYRGKDSIKQLQNDMRKTYGAFNKTMPAATEDADGNDSKRSGASAGFSDSSLSRAKLAGFTGAILLVILL